MSDETYRRVRDRWAPFRNRFAVLRWPTLESMRIEAYREGLEDGRNGVWNAPEPRCPLHEDGLSCPPDHPHLLPTAFPWAGADNLNPAQQALIESEFPVLSRLAREHGTPGGEGSGLVAEDRPSSPGQQRENVNPALADGEETE